MSGEWISAVDGAIRTHLFYVKALFYVGAKQMLYLTYGYE